MIETGDIYSVSFKIGAGRRSGSAPQAYIESAPEMPTPDGFEDIPQDLYVAVGAIPARSNLQYQSILIPNDGSTFLLRSLSGNQTGGTGKLSINLRDANMKAIFDVPIPSAGSAGFLPTHTTSSVFIHPDLIYPPGASVYFDLVETFGGTPAGFEMVIWGVRRYDKSKRYGQC